MKKIRLIVTSTFGLEAIIKRELQDLGYSDFVILDGKVEFEATLADIPKLNLWLRSADRVLIKLAEFRALDFDDLFDSVYDIPWGDWIPQDGKITVIGKSVKSKLQSVRTNQSMVKKAMIEKLRDKYNVDKFSESGDEYVTQISVFKDIAQVTLDTTGEGLHRRGYRKDSGKVPIRENLAAAMVLLSFWEKNRLLVDPMCGSGTIVIEAALIAKNIAPGLNRKFAAECWPSIDSKIWEEARQLAKNEIRQDQVCQIKGYDLDAHRIEDCKANAKRAGVADDIVFEEKDVKDFAPEEDYGIIISNPPYGINLSDQETIDEIYQALNFTFKDKKGWSLYIITADKQFPNFFKRARPNKVRKLFNGAIEVNYYQYFGERPRN